MINPYESPSLASPEPPPIHGSEGPTFSETVLKSGKYWAILLGSALVGVCVILFCANVIVPYLTKVFTGRGQPSEVETSRAITSTVVMLGIGIPVCFVAGAIVGAIKYALGMPHEQKKPIDHENENF